MNSLRQLIPGLMLALIPALFLPGAAALQEAAPAGGAAAAGDLPPGMKVSISGDSLGGMLQQLSQQSRLSFTFQAFPGKNANTAISLDQKEIALWEAMRKIQDSVAAEGTILCRNELGYGEPHLAEPFSHVGAFFIRLNGLTHNAEFGRPDPQIFRANVFVRSDSSTRILAVQHASRPSQAVDEAGNSYVSEAEVPVQFNMVGERRGGGGFSDPAQILLHRPKEAAARKLKTLQGTIPTLIATRLDTIRPTYPTNETRQYGNLKVDIRFDDLPGGPQDAAYVEVAIYFPRPDGMNDVEWECTLKAFSGTRMRHFDPEGKLVLLQTGGESTAASSGRFSVIYPKREGKPPEVTIEIPAEFKLVNIPYKFDNIPLP